MTPRTLNGPRWLARQARPDRAEFVHKVAQGARKRQCWVKQSGERRQMPETFVIAQGGGPTAVINQTVAGATLEIRRRHPGAKVLGSRHGVRGIRDGDYVDLSEIPEEQLRLIGATPGAALGSTRDKPDAAYCDLVLAGLKKEGADAFIYIGGNDTSGTQQILTDASGGSI